MERVNGVVPMAQVLNSYIGAGEGSMVQAWEGPSYLGHAWELGPSTEQEVFAIEIPHTEVPPNPDRHSIRAEP